MNAPEEMKKNKGRCKWTGSRDLPVSQGCQPPGEAWRSGMMTGFQMTEISLAGGKAAFESGLCGSVAYWVPSIPQTLLSPGISLCWVGNWPQLQLKFAEGGLSRPYTVNIMAPLPDGVPTEGLFCLDHNMELDAIITVQGIRIIL